MKLFAELYRSLDQSGGNLARRAALVDYFQRARSADAVWALWLLAGNKLTAAKARIANSTELRAWVTAATGLPDWLVEDSYQHVGDLAETIALLLPEPLPEHDASAPVSDTAPKAQSPAWDCVEGIGRADRMTSVEENEEADGQDEAFETHQADLASGARERPLHVWIEQVLLPVAGQPESVRREVLLEAWRELPFWQRLVLTKLLTGALRIGVSQRLAQQALADYSGVPLARLAQRMLGDWRPSVTFWQQLLTATELPSDRQQPYSFFLASPVDLARAASIEVAGDSQRLLPDEPEDIAHHAAAGLDESPAAVVQLGPINDWLLEWKWDGVRLQLIRRDGEVALWSRGEERLDGRFPELEAVAAQLPHDVVLDGELVAWQYPDSNASGGEFAAAGRPQPFVALQQRIQRRKPSVRLLQKIPVRMLVYDLLELDGIDLREQPLVERRRQLQGLLDGWMRQRPGLAPLMDLSPPLRVADWAGAEQLRAGARERGVEGLMIKRLDSPYRSGRVRGDWWKWKLDPLTIDAVLLYAQPGHGRRSNLFTDYTFGLWDGEQLVPVAKAYSGLTDAEIGQLDRWIRTHTRERFGPVRSVEALQVFELGFEAVNRSSRHKSGLAVRFPRILRWRRDKSAAEADALANLQALAP